ncbi:MAG TPA: hypothetical protein VE153_09090 [Myxococcus sp.]|nr:hypothetical protein [Myxococcus sp.]
MSATAQKPAEADPPIAPPPPQGGAAPAPDGGAAPLPPGEPDQEPSRLVPLWGKWALFLYHVAVLAALAYAAHSVNERRAAEGWALVAGAGGQGIESKQLTPDAPKAQDTASPKPTTDGKSAAAQEAPKRGHYDPIIILVIIAGMLGGALHGLASLVHHSGQGRLHTSWWLFYVSRPFVGGGLGAFIYLILRSGVAGVQIQPNTAAYSLLVWASLAGLFSSPAMRKLRDVFDTVFKTEERPPAARKPKPEAATGGANNNVVHIDPATGKPVPGKDKDKDTA